MIRPFTCVCMLLAAGSGLYLYQTKHRAQMLDREIARTLKVTETVRDRIGVLRGEWAGLNDPERLADLAHAHLGLRSLAPTQFVSLADLPARMPAPLPPGSIVPPADDARPEVIAIAARPAPAVVAAAPPTAPAPKPAPTQLAALPPSQPARPAPKPAPAPALAQDMPAPRFTAPVMPVAASPAGSPGMNWIGESVARAARAARAQTAPAAAPPHQFAPSPVAAPMPTQQASYAGSANYLGSSEGNSNGNPQSSALGGTRTALPAPVPYGAR